MIGAVVIGRNEAENLLAALSSARSAGRPIVYVDSASSDNSVSIAESAGIPAIRLSAPPMLSAARGRNAGLAWLEENAPDIEFVMFLDGDCLLQPDFANKAVHLMRDAPDIAIAVGHLRERATASNVYVRLSTIEWASDVGEMRDFGHLGGIMCARVSAIRSVGGFNPQMIAGEDSELGVRLSLAGYRIFKIDSEMALHDNGIDSFGAWWRRAVRAGHALAQRYALNGRSAVRDCRREFFSTAFWGLVLPLAALLLAWPTSGVSSVLLGGYIILGSRMAYRFQKTGRSRDEALVGACFGVLSKFANAFGLCKYFVNSWSGRFQIIEYKRSPPRPRN
jgi:GT2 family glycosyltransferase